jgi:hypothetical protein
MALPCYFHISIRNHQLPDHLVIEEVGEVLRQLLCWFSGGLNYVPQN